MYKDEELRPYLLDPHKQTLIDVPYFVEKLKATGHEVLVLMDANQAEEQTYQPQSHNVTLVTKKGFHVDSAIGVSLQSFMKCMKALCLTHMHGDMCK
jgi:predicted SpoU family rRNA methylase